MNHKSILFVAVAVAAMFADASNAGRFVLHTYGPPSIRSDDFTDLVTDRFISRYPADKFEIVVHVESDTGDQGGRWCYAFAGVSRAGTYEMPKYRYFSHVSETGSSGSMSAGEKHAWALKCARRAVESMMSEPNLSDVYHPWTPAPKPTGTQRSTKPSTTNAATAPGAIASPTPAGTVQAASTAGTVKAATPAGSVQSATPAGAVVRP